MSVRTAHDRGAAERPQEERPGRPRPARPLPLGRRVCRELGIEPRFGQNPVPRKNPRRPAPPRARGRPGRRPRHRERRPPSRPQRRPRAPDHHRHRLPPGSRNGAPRPRRLGPRRRSIASSSRTSATWSAPPSYDLGEELRLVLLSVTEGEDKPLKYPTIFNGADLAIITKCDLAAAVEFDAPAAHRAIEAVRPGLRTLTVSAKTGAGMEEWLGLLTSRLAGIPA